MGKEKTLLIEKDSQSNKTNNKIIPYRVLVVDDDEFVASAIKDATEVLGVYQTTFFQSGKEALYFIQQDPNKNSFDAYLVDQKMPGMTGVEFMRELVKIDPNALVYLITAEDDGVALKVAESSGDDSIPQIKRYIQKPWHSTLFTVDLKRDLEKVRLEKKLLAVMDQHDQEQKIIEKRISEFEKKIILTEQRYKNLYDNVPDIVFNLDTKGNIKSINHASVEALGFQPEELIGKYFLDVVHDEDALSGKKIINEKRCNERGIHGLIVRVKSKNGGYKVLSFNVSGEHNPPVSLVPKKHPSREYLGNIAVGRDITDWQRAEGEKKALEAQLMIFEKSVALKDIASGLAHEINNPASAVQSNLQTLEKYLGEYNSSYEKERIFNIIKRSKDAIKIVTNIVSAVRDTYRPENWRIVSLNKIIDDQLILLHKKYRNRIRIIKNYQTPYKVKAYSSEINQVMINLLNNAIDSIENDGEISISAREEESFIYVEVKDSGAGMNKEVQKKLFQPYFTTKNEGTGLGLHLSQQIAKRHKGELFVLESKVGIGSTFCLKLPVLEQT